jgi:hypothetical protein
MASNNVLKLVLQQALVEFVLDNVNDLDALNKKAYQSAQW